MKLVASLESGRRSGTCPNCGARYDDVTDFEDELLDENEYHRYYTCPDCGGWIDETYGFSRVDVSMEEKRGGKLIGYEEGLCPRCGFELEGDYGEERSEDGILKVSFRCHSCGLQGEERFSLKYERTEQVIE